MPFAVASSPILTAMANLLRMVATRETRSEVLLVIIAVRSGIVTLRKTRAILTGRQLAVLERLKVVVTMNNARWRIGDLYRIKISERCYGLARLLEFPLCEFYRYFDENQNMPSDLRQMDVAFRLFVMRDAIKSDNWMRVGRNVNDVEVRQHFFMQDIYTGRITSTEDGNKGPEITFEEADKLERAAVWSAIHIEKRLQDLKYGRANKFATSMRPKRRLDG